MANHPHHQRQSIRIKGYDYASPGGYFVTLVTNRRACLFGEVRNNEMVFNPAGKMAIDIWSSLPERYPNIELGIFQVMPNHFHGIIIINDVGATLVVAQNNGLDNKWAGTRPAPTAPTVGEIVGSFKSITTHAYTQGVKSQGWMAFAQKLWQRNYFEHIIRSEEEHRRIYDYIETNPLHWDEDEENPSAKKLTGH